jgi:hypothetical protein
MQHQMASVASKNFPPMQHVPTSFVIKTFAGTVSIQATLSKPGRPSRENARAESEVLDLLTAIEPQADIDTLSRTMSSIDKLIFSGNLVGLNRVLRKVDVKLIEPAAIVTLLRTSFAVRELLPDWKQLRDKAYRSLKRKRLPVERLMHGLLDT